jgi:hypothetical protein
VVPEDAAADKLRQNGGSDELIILTAEAEGLATATLLTKDCK